MRFDFSRIDVHPAESGGRILVDDVESDDGPGTGVALGQIDAGVPDAGDAGAAAGPNAGLPAAAQAQPGAAAAAPACTIASVTGLHAPDGTPDTRTTIGIGEPVNFTAGGAADWTASTGWPRSRSGLATFLWEPAAAGTATITARPAAGGACTLDMTAVAPQGLHGRRVSVTALPGGTAGADMMLDLAAQPASVSFANLETLEEPGPASAVTGYFLAQQTAGADLGHHPTAVFARFHGNNAVPDHAFATGWPPPWSRGSFFWSIPNRWRRAGTTGGGTPYARSVQNFTIAADGTIAIGKQGAFVSRHP